MTDRLKEIRERFGKFDYDSYNHKSDIEYLLSEVERKDEALKQAQWGSCDGCENHMCCPICLEPKEHWWDEVNDCDVNEAIPGKHKPDCVIGQALNQHGGGDAK